MTRDTIFTPLITPGMGPATLFSPVEGESGTITVTGFMDLNRYGYTASDASTLDPLPSQPAAIILTGSQSLLSDSVTYSKSEGVITIGSPSLPPQGWQIYADGSDIKMMLTGTPGPGRNTPPSEPYTPDFPHEYETDNTLERFPSTVTGIGDVHAVGSSLETISYIGNADTDFEGILVPVIGQVAFDAAEAEELLYTSVGAWVSARGGDLAGDGRKEIGQVIEELVGNQTLENSTVDLNWTAEDSSRKWSAVSICGDGRRQLAVAEAGYIYTCNDVGLTWNQKGTLRDWTSCYTSLDGKYKTAVSKSIAGDDAIFRSEDYGETWTAVADTDRDWMRVVMSSDGKYQTATEDGTGYIWRSDDYGETWSAVGDSGSWKGIGMSSDGKHQTAGDGSTNKLYISSNYGVDWDEAPTASGEFHRISLSIDGKFQLAAARRDGAGETGYVYGSDDYGATWTQRTVGASKKPWMAVAMSADGKRQTVADDGAYAPFVGTVWSSYNYGVTWVQTYATLRSWRGIAISDDSSIFTGIAYNDYIYIKKVGASKTSNNYYFQLEPILTLDRFSIDKDGNHSTGLTIYHASFTKVINCDIHNGRGYDGSPGMIGIWTRYCSYVKLINARIWDLIPSDAVGVATGGIHINYFMDYGEYSDDSVGCEIINPIIYDIKGRNECQGIYIDGGAGHKIIGSSIYNIDRTETYHYGIGSPSVPAVTPYLGIGIRCVVHVGNGDITLPLIESSGDGVDEGIRYWRGAGNWTDAKWTYSSGGTPGEAPTPKLKDNIIFDAISSACTLDVNGVGRSINTTGYTNTLDLNDNDLTIEGCGILVAGTILGGSGTFTLNNSLGGTTTFEGLTFTRETSTVICKKMTTFIGGGDGSIMYTMAFYNIKLGCVGTSCLYLSTNESGFVWYNQLTLDGGEMRSYSSNKSFRWVGKSMATPLIITEGTTFIKDANCLNITFAPASLTTDINFEIPELSDPNHAVYLVIEATSSTYYTAGTQQGNCECGGIMLNGTGTKMAKWFTDGYNIDQDLNSQGLYCYGGATEFNCAESEMHGPSVINLKGNFTVNNAGSAFYIHSSEWNLYGNFEANLSIDWNRSEESGFVNMRGTGKYINVDADFNMDNINIFGTISLSNDFQTRDFILTSGSFTTNNKTIYMYGDLDMVGGSFIPGSSSIIAYGDVSNPGHCVADDAETWYCSGGSVDFGEDTVFNLVLQSAPG